MGIEGLINYVCKILLMATLELKRGVLLPETVDFSGAAIIRCELRGEMSQNGRFFNKAVASKLTAVFASCAIPSIM